MMRVTFKSNGRSGRVWDAVFDLGNREENQGKALEVAWNMNASIVSVEEDGE